MEIIVLLLIVSIIVYFLSKVQKRVNNEIAQDKALDSDFMEDSKHNWSTRGFGIAMISSRETIKFRDHDLVKEYPYSDVRGWTTNLQTGGRAIGGGLQVATHNLQTARQNAASSGLFIDVRDVDRPQWRIPLKTEAEMLRWNEILKQEINKN